MQTTFTFTLCLTDETINTSVCAVCTCVIAYLTMAICYWQLCSRFLFKSLPKSCHFFEFLTIYVPLQQFPFCDRNRLARVPDLQLSCPLVPKVEPQSWLVPNTTASEHAPLLPPSMKLLLLSATSQYASFCAMHIVYMWSLSSSPLPPL